MCVCGCMCVSGGGGVIYSFIHLKKKNFLLFKRTVHYGKAPICQDCLHVDRLHNVIVLHVMSGLSAQLKSF